ncbi:MAG: PD40 domain-containing protein [Planctomycetes bacterium]|nr:PD40 domain-containing protein [Planctomycetota bacterium]
MYRAAEARRLVPRSAPALPLALLLGLVLSPCPRPARADEPLLLYRSIDQGFAVGYPRGWSLLQSDQTDAVSFLFTPEAHPTAPEAVSLGFAITVFRTREETAESQYDGSMETLLSKLGDASKEKGGDVRPGPIRPIERAGLRGRRCRLKARDAKGVSSESELRLFFKGQRTYLVLWMADSGPNEASIELLEKSIDSFRVLEPSRGPEAGAGPSGRDSASGPPDVTADAAKLFRRLRWTDAGSPARPARMALLGPDQVLVADARGVLYEFAKDRVTRPFGDAPLAVSLAHAGKTLFLVGDDGVLRVAAGGRAEEVTGLGGWIDDVVVLGAAAYVFRRGGEIIRIPLSGDADPQVLTRDLELRDAPRPVAADGFLYFLAYRKGSSPVAATEEIVLAKMVERVHRVLSPVPRRELPLDVVPMPDGVILRYANRIMIVDPSGLRQTDLPAAVDQMVRVGEAVFVLKQGGVLALAGEDRAVLDTGAGTVRLLAAEDHVGFEKAGGEILYAPVKALLDATVRAHAVVNTDWVSTALLVRAFPAALAAVPAASSGASPGTNTAAPEPAFAYVTPAERGGQTLWVRGAGSGSEAKALLVPGELRGVRGRPAWSPDRRFLAFAADFATYDRAGPRLNVTVVEVATGRPRTITRSRHDGGFLYGYDAPSWRPDGKGLLVRQVRIPDASGDQGSRPPAQGVRVEQLLFDPSAGLPETPESAPRAPLSVRLPGGAGGLPVVRWSPNRLLLLSVAGLAEGVGSGHAGDAGTAVSAAIGFATETACIGRASGLETNLAGDGLAWSPDGERLLGAWTQGLSTNLWSIELASGRWRRLTNLEPGVGVPEYDWSADGQAVYYAPGDGRRLFRLGLASDQAEVVAEGGPFTNVSAGAR